MNISEIYLAALMHDIGKFQQRSVPEYKFTKHEIIGAGYLEQLTASYTLRRLVEKHHGPEAADELIIAIADKLSAAEREEGGTRQDATKEPLVSILGRVQIELERGTKGPIPPEHYIPLKIYRHEDVPYPVAAKEDALADGGYAQLWRDFDHEFHELAPALHDDPYQPAILYLLEKYLSVMPSAAYYSRATVSLFDHAKTTAALATCLAAAAPPDQELQELHWALQAMLPMRGKRDPQNDLPDVLRQPRFLMLAGDISGIQDFIYDVPMDGAAKNLRGRSFFLGYLTKLLAEYILRQENMPPACALLVGGGKFSLLLPLAAAERVDAYRREIERVMFAAFGGKLAVLLAAAPLAPADFLQGRWAQKWDEAGTALAREKHRKWSTLLMRDPQQVLGPFPAAAHVCRTCWRPVADGEELCSFCRGFIAMGDMLPKARYIAEKIGHPAQVTMQTANDVLLAFGIDMRLTERPLDGYNNYVLNSYDFLAQKGQGFYFLPQLRADKTFDELADAARGVKTWGVLRGDVDNLSLIFRQGLGENLSLSAFASLSRAVSAFFGIYFNDILREFRDQVYTVYAGGDDFFIVGSWSVLPSVAGRLRKAFARYVAGNTNVTFSAAIHLASHRKHPLFAAAERAGQLLDEAKDTAEEKNRLAFMGAILTWPEFEALQSYHDNIAAIIDGGGSRALLQHLYFTDRLARQARETGGIFKIWQAVYLLHNYRQRLKNQAKEDMEELIARTLTGRTQVYPHIAQAVRWTELAIRE